MEILVGILAVAVIGLLVDRLVNVQATFDELKGEQRQNESERTSNLEFLSKLLYNYREETRFVSKELSQIQKELKQLKPKKKAKKKVQSTKKKQSKKTKKKVSKRSRK